MLKEAIDQIRMAEEESRAAQILARENGARLCRTAREEETQRSAQLCREIQREELRRREEMEKALHAEETTLREETERCCDALRQRGETHMVEAVRRIVWEVAQGWPS